MIKVKDRQIQTEQMASRVNSPFSKKWQICYQNCTENILNLHKCRKKKTFNKKYHNESIAIEQSVTLRGGGGGDES